MLEIPLPKGRGFWIILGITGLAIGVTVSRLHTARVQSMQAFVNGQFVHVRAPVSGKLLLKSGLQLGHTLTAKEDVAKLTSEIENPRVSELTINQQELRTRLQTSSQQLKGIREQLANKNWLLKLFVNQAKRQQALQDDYAQQQVKQHKSDLDKAKASEEIAVADARRYTQLASAGAIDLSTAQRKRAEAKQASAEAKAKQAQLSQALLAFRAAANGLQLDGPRTLSYPEIRMLELRSEVTDLEQQAALTRSLLQGVEAELVKNRQELQTQQITRVQVPEQGQGVIWSIDAQSGDNLAANAPILTLLDCTNVWVEAFVNEHDASALSIGQPAAVKLLGSNTSWVGRIQTIRAGTGRVEVGSYVAQPPPEIARRQLPVRTATVRVQVDWPDTRSSQEFCRAGRSVDVKFE